MRKLIVGAVALVAALAFTVSGALGSEQQTPGITSKKILIGGTFPLTGPLAGYAPVGIGMRTYFSYINGRRGPDKKRGIMGRQIEFKIYDDSYNPAQTVQLTRKLVEEDKVFAVVGQLGTEPVLAARGYLNQRKVPQSLVATGASYWGTQGKEYPWTIGFQQDYVSEGRLFGQHIRRNHNGKKIAVLYQNDDYGKDYLLGLRQTLGRQYADQNIVAQQSYEVTQPNLTSELARIRSSGAQILVLFTTPPHTIRAYGTGRALGYNPEQIYLNSVSSAGFWLNFAVAASNMNYVNGSLSVTAYKDPANPAQANDPAVREYKRIMAKYAPSANANNATYFSGFAYAEAFVQAMYKAGKNPTRESYMRALTNMNSTNRFLLPGVRMKTGKGDRFIISQMRLQRFNNGAWTPVGGLVEGRPNG